MNFDDVIAPSISLIMPTVFHESDLLFTFSDQWQIKSFDRHPFYQALAGQGLKGVDFIGVLNGEQVVLMEVKNYRVRFPTAIPPIQNKLTGASPAIVATMRRKATDTQRVLRVIRKYYQKRWWLRPARWLLRKLPLRYQLGIEWLFWLWVEDKVARGDFTLALWMELDDTYDSFDAIQLRQLRKRVQRQLRLQLSDLASDTILVDMKQPLYLDNSVNVCHKK